MKRPRLQVVAVLLDAIRAARRARLLERIQRASDERLACQLRDALSSAVANAAEGNRSYKGNRRKHFGIAIGSVDEAVVHLHAAEAWGYVDDNDVDAVLTLLDRASAMLASLLRK